MVKPVKAARVQWALTESQVTALNDAAREVERARQVHEGAKQELTRRAAVILREQCQSRGVVFSAAIGGTIQEVDGKPVLDVTVPVGAIRSRT